MKRIVVIFNSHNRLEYTKIALPQVIEEVKNSKTDIFLLICDDNSTDGTLEYIQSTVGYDLLLEETRGDSVWAINRGLEVAREIEAEFIYHMANDVIYPDGIIDKMVKLMDQHQDACSMMVEECFNLPYIHPLLTVSEHVFTSSSGIHRIEAFPGELKANDRFFGFEQYQRKAIKTLGFACYRVKGIGITNLDGSPWSRQMEYLESGYGRTGLVGNGKSVYIIEQVANELKKKK